MILDFIIIFVRSFNPENSGTNFMENGEILHELCLVEVCMIILFFFDLTLL